MAYCIKCGTKLEDGAKFCTACGADQELEKAAFETPVYGEEQNGYSSAGDQQAPYGGNEANYGYSAQSGSVPWEPEVKKKKGKGLAAGVIAAVVVIFALFVILVSGIGGGKDFAKSVTILVQGNVDELYLGKFNKDYMDLIGTTEAECEQNYLDGLETEAEYFAYYFDIEYMSDQLKADIIDLYKEIYSHSRYTVGDASKLDDDTYAVKMDIYPIDVMDQVTDAIYDGAMDWFLDKYTEEDVEAMTDEEYEVYDEEWAYGIIDIVREQLPNLGYMDAETIVVQVVRGSDNIWTISDNDMGTIDEYILYYS